MLCRKELCVSVMDLQLSKILPQIFFCGFFISYFFQHIVSKKFILFIK